jgi:FixJ family two-component response regulator
MQNRNLYFVTDDQRPNFPIATAANYFQIIVLPNSLGALDWFDWNNSGCLVCESPNPSFAISMVRYLRRHWINLPTVLYSVTHGKPMPITGFPEFARVFGRVPSDGLLINELIHLARTDETGTPSPLELRQRFGKLGNQERKVLNLSLQGETSKEIAEQLNIRYQTVDKYRRNALQRMKAKNLVVLLRQWFRSIERDSQPDLKPT